MTTANRLRTFLHERQQAGSRQVGISTLLELIDAAEADEKVTSNGKGKKVTITRAPVVDVKSSGVPIYGNGDLVGSQEAAALLGVDKTRPSKWRIHDTRFGPENLPFPEPVCEVSTGPLFLRSEVEALRPFVEERRRAR